MQSTYSINPDLFLGPEEGIEMGRALKVWWYFEDFVFGGGKGQGLWDPAASGTGASADQGVPTALRPGIFDFHLGTTNAGYTHIRTTGSYREFLFGSGIYTIEADIYITNLSTVTETYALRFGFGDVPNADFVDGAYFEYTDAGSTPNWYKCTASNSTRTKTNTTIAATAGIWTRLKVVVNSDGTSVEYFINGTSAGVVTTNIPTGANRNTAPIFTIVKSAGTTDRIFSVDWAWIHVDLTTSR